MKKILFFIMVIWPNFACAQEAKQKITFHAPDLVEAALISKVFHEDPNIDWGMKIRPFDAQKDVNIAWVRLGNEGEPALLASFWSVVFCGTAGCDFHIWKKTKSGWKEIYDGKGDADKDGRSDIYILPSKHHGLHDLKSLEEDHVLRYDGKMYR